ncbi:MAG TPA: hypothetical protein VHD56_06280 [Tepidisphaeraceae bacterium]|nr:hypothetical protein [Tepidisphaeraceae bacterium]
MKIRIIHLDRLLSRKVFDIDGICAGRIEEAVTRTQAGEHFVEEFLLGRGGLFERLSIPHVALKFVRLLGARGRLASHRVKWEQMDLSDPTHPRLRCRINQLTEIH